MAGHVFIVRGDLTKLYCDAWLMPTDYSLEIMPHWLKIPGLRDSWEPGPAPEAWKNHQSRVMEVNDWPEEKPRPWLVNTGGGRFAKPEWYSEGVKEFVQTTARALRSQQNDLSTRTKFLLGIPLVGTGAGGARERTGNVLHPLIKTLHEASAEEDVDIVLTVKSGSDYAAALHARNYLDSSGLRFWPKDLTEGLRIIAGRLAEFIKRGELVLFLGSGVSAGAGLPTWKILLQKLAEKAGVFNCVSADTQKTCDDFTDLNNLDQARLISELFNKMDLEVGEEIAKLFRRHRHYSLAHAILAALQVDEVVTTNYDTLFEEASASAQTNPPRVLPYNPSMTGTRWVLKLHGCVTHPKDIVLTRSDYLRYDEKRAALKGIVQAMLMTRHMLFVGFSLRDENFERIIDDVRKAIRGDSTAEQQDPDKTFATTLMPRTNLFLQKLWQKDVDWVDFQRPGGIGESARLQEIFLDYLASISTSCTAHLIESKHGNR